MVTSDCFDVFGVQPILGRLLLAEETPLLQPGARVAVIGHAFWTRAFGADPGVLDRVINTEGIPLRIVGVLTPGFGGLQADFGADVFVPFDTLCVPARDTCRFAVVCCHS